MTFRGMRGWPGLRTYSSPVAGIQSGSSRSASAASSEMRVPSHSSSIVLATSRGATSLARISSERPSGAGPAAPGVGVDAGPGVLREEVGRLALEQALDAAPAPHYLPLRVVDEGVVDEALEVLEERS